MLSDHYKPFKWGLFVGILGAVFPASVVYCGCLSPTLLTEPAQFLVGTLKLDLRHFFSL
jgi:hypothetical protein